MAICNLPLASQSVYSGLSYAAGSSYVHILIVYPLAEKPSIVVRSLRLNLAVQSLEASRFRPEMGIFPLQRPALGVHHCRQFIFYSAVFNQAQAQFSPACPDHSLQSLFHPILFSLFQLVIQTRPLEAEVKKDKGIYLGCAESW